MLKRLNINFKCRPKIAKILVRVLSNDVMERRAQREREKERETFVERGVIRRWFREKAL